MPHHHEPPLPRIPDDSTRSCATRVRRPVGRPVAPGTPHDRLTGSRRDPTPARRRSHRSRVARAAHGGALQRYSRDLPGTARPVAAPARGGWQRRSRICSGDGGAARVGDSACLLVFHGWAWTAYLLLNVAGGRVRESDRW
jgi:hypothetical protein